MPPVLCFALPLVPSDVADLAADGYKLINFDDLCSRLRFAGPKEQLFFIDACRDLGLGETPGNVPFSAHSFGFAIFSAAHGGYDAAVLFTGSPVGTLEETLDTACTVHVADGNG